MRFRIRTVLIFVAIAAVVAFAISILMQVNNTVRNAYAGWWVGDMVVEHLRANNDEWPRYWNDLIDDYQTCVAIARAQRWEFDELRDRVKVDWGVDATNLVRRQSDGKPDFKVNWLSDGTNASWADAEPNEIILGYLNQKR